MRCCCFLPFHLNILRITQTEEDRLQRMQARNLEFAMQTAIIETKFAVSGQRNVNLTSARIARPPTRPSEIHHTITAPTITADIGYFSHFSTQLELQGALHTINCLPYLIEKRTALATLFVAAGMAVDNLKNRRQVGTTYTGQTDRSCTGEKKKKVERKDRRNSNTGSVVRSRCRSRA